MAQVWLLTQVFGHNVKSLCEARVPLTLPSMPSTPEVKRDIVLLTIPGILPEIQLMTGTQYKSDNPEWRRADANMTNATLMKCISVGNGGVWAINAKDNGVMCRLEKCCFIQNHVSFVLVLESSNK